MKLRDWIEMQGITDAEFARRLGVASWTVARYADHGRVPTREVMERIVTTTEGSVQPNDFYEVSPAE